MPQRLNLITLTVRDYDQALAFYIGTLGFTLIEDTDRGHGKRWIRIAPAGTAAPSTPATLGQLGQTSGAELLLAKAVTPEQLVTVGNQTGGRVFLFLETDNLQRDYDLYRARGVKFEAPLRIEPYGKVAVFRDLYGNRWDLIEPA